MRKIEIRDRTRDLDARLLNGKDRPEQQRAERARLIDACEQAGDHVHESRWITGRGVAYVCEFCGHDRDAAQHRTARNLSTAF
jgi:hypothetical protein